MIRACAALLVAILAAGDDPGAEKVRALFATIESLQKPVEDFRCEFEETIRFNGILGEQNRVGKDGLFERASGVYIRKAGGDIRVESLVVIETMRGRPDFGAVAWHSAALRAREKLAEYENRNNEQTSASVGFGNKKDELVWNEGLGRLFPLARIKADAAAGHYALEVSDGTLEGRAVKVLRLIIENMPGRIYGKCFIDLERNGHVVRVEHYSANNALSGWLDVELARFKVGDRAVWMLVCGESIGLMANGDGQPVLLKEPQSIMKLRVVEGTMEFNKHPGPQVITVRSKPDLPRTESFRKLENEFARQQVNLNPANARALDAARFRPWIAATMGALVLVCCVGVWIWTRRS